MAEVEVGGIKFKGGKLVIVFTVISTLGGGLWAGFEFYKDYMDMREKIESYTAPDLSGFDKKLAVMEKTMKEIRREMKAVRGRVTEVQTVVRDIREDTRADAGKLYSGISAVDRRSRTLDAETRKVMRTTEKNIREITETAITRFDTKTNSAASRFESKINAVDSKLDALEKRILKIVKRALDNPLLKNK